MQAGTFSVFVLLLYGAGSRKLVLSLSLFSSSKAQAHESWYFLCLSSPRRRRKPSLISVGDKGNSTAAVSVPAEVKHVFPVLQMLRFPSLPVIAHAAMSVVAVVLTAGGCHALIYMC